MVMENCKSKRYSAIILLAIPLFLLTVPSFAASSANFRSMKDEAGYAGKPISLLSGAESMTRDDLTLGNIFPISIERSYHSKSGYDSPLGYGWTHNYDKRLYTYADGSVIIRKNTGWKRKFIPSGEGFVTPVGETGTLVKNADGTYTWTEKDGTRENYDLMGRLESTTDPRGNALILSYESTSREPLTGLLPANVDQSTPLVVANDYRLSMITEVNHSAQPTGVFVIFQYESSTGRLTGLTDSLGRNVIYGHDTIGNLTTVTTPANKATYSYTNSSNKHFMTTIDEGDGLYTNTYDTYGRVSRQTHGTGRIDFVYDIPYKKATITTSINDFAGTLLNSQTRAVEFDDLGQPIKVTDTFGNVTNYARDGQMNITREEHWENTGTVTAPNLVLKTATDYTYDANGNMLTKTEAQGTDAEHTVTYTYDPTYNQVLTRTVKSVVNPSQYRTTTNVYDSYGSKTSSTESGLLGSGTPFSYTTTYQYDANGQITGIDGPRTDAQDVITFTYGSTTGFLTSMTQPIVGTTTFSDHDGLGNPRTVTDPNGNSFTYTYDQAGRVLTAKAPGDTGSTQYAYTTSGCSSCGGVANRISYIILPEGDRIDYTYDTNGKLSRIADSQGNSVNYAYDSEGNRLKEEIKDPQAVLQKSLSFQYDALNRLTKAINPDSSYSQIGYDALGNQTSVKDPLGNTTTYQYDALSRVISAIQPGSVTTGFGYDSGSNLTRVTDANSHSTTYVYDDTGRVYQTVSPDTGTTTYSYDPAGNLATKTDASGVTVTYSYDALNRLTKIDFPSDTDIVYAYDSCVNGKGRLCSVTDQSGSTVYEYTKKGQIAKETRTIDGVAYLTQYTYDHNGNTRTVTYPSGRVITYNYANTRVTGVLNNSANLASNITYKPFGGMNSITFGNGLAGSFGYDNQYRVATIQAGTLQSLSYGYDANGNVTGIVNNLDNTKNKSYTYDNLNRLATATGPWGSLSWTLDPVGNRLTQVDSSGTSSYTYASGSNRLSGITGPSPSSFTSDANGNTLSENAKVFTYNQNQRLIQAASTQTGNYVYNANGQRVKKTVGGAVTVYHYDQNGQLIAESSNTGAVQAEYVYLNGIPLAKIDGSGTQYIHTDHLGTPVMMTDGARAIVWEIENRPFGDGATVTGTASLNLRFPGQYYDAESGLNYNYFRDYNPAVGRYVQADPIGLMGGDNLYRYVLSSPVNYVDLEGLRFDVCPNCSTIDKKRMESDLISIEQALAYNAAIHKDADAKKAYHDFLALKNDKHYVVTIDRSYGDNEYSRYFPWKTVLYNPDKCKYKYARNARRSKNRKPFIGLSHEVGHAIDQYMGIDMDAPSSDRSRFPDISEEHAVGFENQIRRGLWADPLMQRPRY